MRCDLYTVSKTINNNAVQVYDKTGREMIIVGKGIGFSARKGDILNDDADNRVFIHKKEAEILHFIDFIPVDIIELTNKIIQKSEHHLDEKLSDSLLIALAEHISFAIKRFEKGNSDDIHIHEVQFLYLNEYDIGKRAVEYINKIKNIQLPDSEASLIALHFVNARLNNKNVGETLKLTKLSYQIANLISYHFHITIDKSSLNFSRFIIHLKLLIVRCKELQLHGMNNKSSSLIDDLKKQFLTHHACAEKIVKLISHEYNLTVPDDEIFYLTVHIERLLQVD